MIVQEVIEGNLIKTYSGKGVYIRGGFPEGLYSEAIDPVSAGRVYEETDIPIDSEEEQDETKLKAEAYDILMGES